MTTKHLVEYMFFSFLSMVGTFGVSYIKDISKSLTTLTTNVVELNGKIELMTEKMIEADMVLKDHEARLRKIEHTRSN